MNEASWNPTQVRKTFSRIGLALCVILVVASVLQMLIIEVPGWIWGAENWLEDFSWSIWLVSFIPLYLVAIPAGVLIMRKIPAETPRDNKLSAKNFLMFFAMSLCMMYGGNLIGTFLSMLLSGGNAENAIIDYAMDTNPLKILFMVILAPLLEEYVCRKQIIDRTRRYGEKTAVFLSAIIFGLLHQNLFQFFYAFGIGLIFGYMYIRTGRLRYTVILHSIVNFMGAVIAPGILSLVDIEALSGIDPFAAPEELIELYMRILPGLLISMLYLLILLGFTIAGLVLLITKSKKLLWKEAEAQIPKGAAAKTVYWNVGMVLYILLCGVNIVLALM